MKGMKSFKRLMIIALVVLLAGAAGIPVAAQDGHDPLTFSGGSGTVADPYLISNLADLKDFVSGEMAEGNYRNGVYKLTANIDLGDYAWQPGQVDFHGTFDGNGHTITIRKFAPGQREIGFFDRLADGVTVKNLTIKADINQTISTKDDLSFGLLAGSSGGVIENCITEGTINLTVSGAGRAAIGAMVGRANEGQLKGVLNKAALTVKVTGSKEVSIGGVVGEGTGNLTFANVTNQGPVAASYEGLGLVGGIVGVGGFGAKFENLLNTGKLSVKIIKAQNDRIHSTGGIVGELREGTMDKALNKGNISVEYTGPYVKEELCVSGVAGNSERAKLKNVGNEGNLECKGAKIQHVIGISKAGREVTVNNAYSKGKLYAYSPDNRAELYVMGLGENLPTNNFYFGGTASLKAGSLKEINSEALANIRRGDKTSIYNYCYWNSKLVPFPGYPGLNKAAATSKPVNISTGQLTAAVSIGAKSYSNLSDALNAWVSANGSGYLKWTKAATPTFDWAFGYQGAGLSTPDPKPEPPKQNSKEGKWKNTSDWAVEWMERADSLNIIPAMLLNADMTKQISRKEFAAVAVALYENMKGQKYEAVGDSPFKDTDDPDIIKAYELGLVAGKTKDLYGPGDPLTREQAATMLTRAYKAVYWEGWTLDDDPTYTKHTLDTSGVKEFNDHKQIGGYAKDSVYFMNKNKIIDGTGNNNFTPKALATREQAFKISVATITELK